MKVKLIREIIDNYVHTHYNVPRIQCGELVNFIKANENNCNSAERKILQIVPNILNQGQIAKLAEIAGYYVDVYHVIYVK